MAGLLACDCRMIMMRTRSVVRTGRWFVDPLSSTGLTFPALRLQALGSPKLRFCYPSSLLLKCESLIWATGPKPLRRGFIAACTGTPSCFFRSFSHVRQKMRGKPLDFLLEAEAFLQQFVDDHTYRACLRKSFGRSTPFFRRRVSRRSDATSFTSLFTSRR